MSNHPYSCEECTCPNLCGTDPECLDNCITYECGGGGGGNFGWDYAELVDAVRTGTLDATEMAATRLTFEVNEKRRALQVFDCDGAVIVHAPLPALN
jgi:hypothetical protein